MQTNSTKNTNKKNKTLTIIVSAFLVGAFCICLFVIVQILSKGYVSFGKYSFFRVVTGSMGESLPIDTLTITKNQEIDNIKTGDIVTFKSETPNTLGMLITHRVVDVVNKPDGSTVLLTKGDANLSVDAHYVDQPHLVGKVVWSTAEDGFLASLISFITNKIGFIVCIVFPCLLIAGFILSETARRMKLDIDEVMDIMNKKEELKQETEEEMRTRILAELKEELSINAESEDRQ